MIEKPNLFLTLTYLLLTDSAGASLAFADINSDLAVLDQYQVQEDSDDVIQQFFNIFLSNRTTTTSTTTSKPQPSGKGVRNNTGLKINSKAQNDRGFYGILGAEDIGIVDDSELYGQTDGIVTAMQGTSGDFQRTLTRGSKTRGFHRIHHKDEYKKDRIFFEDDLTNGTLHKSLGQGMATRTGTGNKVRKAKSRTKSANGVIGKTGIFDIGSLQKQLEEFSNSRGFDGSDNSNT